MMGETEITVSTPKVVTESYCVPPKKSEGEARPQKNKTVALDPVKAEAVAEPVSRTGENVSTTEGSGDNSSRIVETLSEKQRKIFEEIPLDKAITVDYLTAAGFSMGEVMSTLTILEIKGLISSLPGALYVRK